MKKNRITPIVIAAGIVLAAAARVFMVSRIDMLTGLLRHDSSLLCNILYYGLIFMTAVGAVVSSHIDKKRGVCGSVDLNPSPKGMIAVGFAMLAAALCACYDGIEETKSFSPSAYLIAVDFIFAAAFCVIAFATLYLKEFKPGLGFSYVFAGIYYVCRGIYIFMNRMAIVTFPEYLADSLTVICGAVFFTSFAKLFSGNGGKLTVKSFFAWGTLTCVMSCSSYLGAAVSKLFLGGVSERIVFSANQSEYYFQALYGVDAYQMAFPPLPNAALGVFAAVSMIAVCFARPEAKGQEASDEK